MCTAVWRTTAAVVVSSQIVPTSVWNVSLWRLVMTIFARSNKTRRLLLCTTYLFLVPSYYYMQSSGIKLRSDVCVVLCVVLLFSISIHIFSSSSRTNGEDYMGSFSFLCVCPPQNVADRTLLTEQTEARRRVRCCWYKNTPTHTQRTAAAQQPQQRLWVTTGVSSTWYEAFRIQMYRKGQ